MRPVVLFLVVQRHQFVVLSFNEVRFNPFENSISGLFRSLIHSFRCSLNAPLIEIEHGRDEHHRVVFNHLTTYPIQIGRIISWHDKQVATCERMVCHG